MIGTTEEIFLVYVLGRPGAGKGTMCKLLSEKFACTHISVGDLLRKMREEKACPDSAIATHIEKSILMPGDTLVKILHDTVSALDDRHRVVLMDGFPRNMDQLRTAETHLGRPDLVLFIDCYKSTARLRYLTRKVAGRLADNAELFERRDVEFEALNPSILDYYRKLGILIEVDTNSERSDSYDRIAAALQRSEIWATQMNRFEQHNADGRAQ